MKRAKRTCSSYAPYDTRSLRKRHHHVYQTVTVIYQLRPRRLDSVMECTHTSYHINMRRSTPLMGRFVDVMAQPSIGMNQLGSKEAEDDIVIFGMDGIVSFYLPCGSEMVMAFSMCLFHPCYSTSLILRWISLVPKYRTFVPFVLPTYYSHSHL